jgi:hypothetical protein
VKDCYKVMVFTGRFNSVEVYRRMRIEMRETPQETALSKEELALLLHPERTTTPNVANFINGTRQPKP